jgi:general secretion pathway protein G
MNLNKSLSLREIADTPVQVSAPPAKSLIRMGRLNRLAREGARQEVAAESGFTLLELMIVIAIILIMASFAAPTYSRIVTRSHEAVLKDDLFTMRKMIDQYTQDNHKPPESLDDLVTAGYLEGGLPNDPFTGSNRT